MNAETTTATVDELLTRRDVANIVKVDPNTIDRMAEDGRLPKAIDLGIGKRALRWRRSEINAWIAGGCMPVEGAASSAGGAT